MAIADHVAPWRGSACRHLPDGSPFDVLDVRYAGRDPDNRWNQGEPTLYVAADGGVALAELARHLRQEASPHLLPLVSRRLYTLHLRLDRVLDLTSATAWRDLGLNDAPACFLDKSVARATAAFARYALRVQAIRVPSVAFLDRPDRWCLVVFLEQVATGFVERIEPGPVVRLES